jgi:uncharacterized membrane protein
MVKKSKATSTNGFITWIQQAWSQVWRYLVSGLLVWIPLIISVWVAWFVFDRIVFGMERLVKSLFGTLNDFGGRYPQFSFFTDWEYRDGTGFMLALALFLGTGVLARYIVGRKIIGFGERLLQRIPFISRVYRAVRQIRDVFISREGSVFQKVCMVDYPRQGMSAVAFVTSREHGIVQEVLNKPDLVAVFIPTTPNPTSGFLVYLPESEITILDISVEDAMKLIISGGAYVPRLATLEQLEHVTELSSNPPVRR